MTTLTFKTDDGTRVAFTGAVDADEWHAWVHTPTRTVTWPVAARMRGGRPFYSVSLATATVSSYRLSELATALAGVSAL